MDLLSLADGLFGFLIQSLLARNLALVVKLAALGQREFTFKSTVLQINAERNKCEPLLHSLSDQAPDLRSIQQEFSGPERIVIRVITVRIGADMTIEQPDFSGFHQSVGILEVDSAIAGGLNLSPRQYNSGFKFLEDIVVEERLPVDSDVLAHLVAGAPGNVVPSGVPRGWNTGGGVDGLPPCTGGRFNVPADGVGLFGVGLAAAAGVTVAG